MTKAYQGPGRVRNGAGPCGLYQAMAEKKSETTEVIDTHKVTPEADEVRPDPRVKMPFEEPKGLQTERTKPGKTGEKGPLKVGVDFDHTDA